MENHEFDTELVAEILATPRAVLETALAQAGHRRRTAAETYPEAAARAGYRQPVVDMSARRERAGAYGALKLLPAGFDGGGWTGRAPWPRAPRILQSVVARWRGTDLADRLESIPRRLMLAKRSAAAASLGIPDEGSSYPSEMELRIRAVHAREANAVVSAAQDRVADLNAKLTELSRDEPDGADEFVHSVSRSLREIETMTAARLPDLMRRRISRSINFVLREDERWTPPSFLSWIGAVIVTTGLEAVLSSFLFAPSMGSVGALALGLGLGVSTALIGVLLGVSLARLRKRRFGPTNRRIAASLNLGLATLGVVVTGWLLLLSGHYAAVLRDGVPSHQVAQLVAQEFQTHPFTPLFDVGFMPFFFCGMASVVVIAWKTIPSFMFLDLRRAQRAQDDAMIRISRCVQAARDACEDARREALARIEALANHASLNASQALRFAAERAQVRDGAYQNLRLIADSQALCEQQYREVVSAVHPAGHRQSRFLPPPASLDVSLPPPAEGEAAVVQEIHIRAIAVRERGSRLRMTVDDLVDEAWQRILNSANEMEAEQRPERAIERLEPFRKPDLRIAS